MTSHCHRSIAPKEQWQHAQATSHVCGGQADLEQRSALEVLASSSLLLPCLADGKLALHECGVHGQTQVHHVLQGLAGVDDGQVGPARGKALLGKALV